MNIFLVTLGVLLCLVGVINPGSHMLFAGVLLVASSVVRVLKSTWITALFLILLAYHTFVVGILRDGWYEHPIVFIVVPFIAVLALREEIMRPLKNNKTFK